MSVPLRVMLVDDEAPAREGLRVRLKREAGVTILGEFADAQSALAAIQADAPDVLFLDISMPGLDGFALLDRLEDVQSSIVFVTAHDEHAVRAFGVRAMDYLLKPVEQDRLHETLKRARAHVARVGKAEVAERMQTLLREVADAGLASAAAAANSPAQLTRIPGRGANDAIQFVAVDDIDWIEAAGDAVKLHAGKSALHVNRSMGEMLAMLDPRVFARIHRSTIVKMDRVRELQPYFHGEYIVVLRDGTKLKLSRGQRAAVSRLLGNRSPAPPAS